MKDNQPDKTTKKLALHFICKASFYLVFWVHVLSFGQLYVSDSTTLVLQGDVFISEEFETQKITTVYIDKEAFTSNFPTEGNFVVIDETAHQDENLPKNVLTERNELSPKAKVELSDKIEVLPEVFVRIDKAADRTLLSLHLHQIHAVVEVNSKNKEKHFDQFLTDTGRAFNSQFSTTNFEIQDIWNKSNKKTSLFAPRGPPFLLKITR